MLRYFALMKIFLTATFLCAFVFPSLVFAEIPPIQDSRAFIRYKNRIKTDLSKLVYLMERFNLPGLEIKIDGNIYPASLAFPFARAYLAINYSKEKAEDWIQKHCYRSPFTNEVMLVRVDGGPYEVGRDFLLRELEALKASEHEING